MDFHRITAGTAPRVAAIVGVGILATAGVTWAAGQGLPQTGAVPTVTAAVPATPIVVPDVRQQAFVFAKETLEDAGFAWKVSGSVHGFPANTVVGQTPAPGTRVIDTGAPLVTVLLKKNKGYGEQGEAQDASPYTATELQPADLAAPVGPAKPAATATPAATTPASTTKTATTPAKQTATTPAKTATTPAKTATTATKTDAKPAAKTPAKAPARVSASAHWPKSRPPAFVVPGGKPEPLDEMPLPDRAQALSRWLDTHTTRTSAEIKYWLYQNEWIVTGARLGWWHGAEALQTLIAVDTRAQSIWQIGSKSAGVAGQALRYVDAKTKS